MVKIGFLASHGGSGMNAILQAVENGLNAQPVVLICNNKNAGAFDIARAHNMPICHLSSQMYDDAEQLDAAICNTLLRYEVDLLVLSGYMKKLGAMTLSTFDGRILNIHPALLPNYGGLGMYGDFVHQAVIANHEHQSGASVHIVTEEYDQGPVLHQKTVDLDVNETVDSLREKVKNLEGGLYVETLQKIINGDISLPGFEPN